MIKIKNPYSRNRYTRKEKFYRAFTKIAIQLLLRLPKTNNKLITTLKLQLKYNLKNRLRPVAPPDHVGVKFLGMTASELVLMENINDFRVGAKKLIRKFPGKRFLIVNNPDDIDKFCDNVELDIYGRSWYQLGTIEFDKDSSIGHFIKVAEISASHISSSLIVVHFSLHPSDEYISEINSLIDAEMQDELVFKPKLKTFFKTWGLHSSSAPIYKQKLIEDLILELKWRFLKEINIHFRTHFYNNNLPAPSIEVYKLNQSECKLNYKEDGSHFFQSLGFEHTDYNDISKDGVWKLNYKERERIDNSVKISCNSNMSIPFGHQHIESEILHQVSFFINSALPILVIRTFTKRLSEQIASFRNSIFKSIQKKRKYAQILKQRFEFEKNLHVLSRIKSEYEQDDFNWLKIEMANEFVEMNPTDTRFQDKTWIDSIVDATVMLINETFNHSKAISKIFDDYLQLMNAETNLKLQKRTVRLTVITVLLTIITIVLTLIALYLTFYQITMAQKNLSDLISGIKDFFK